MGGGGKAEKKGSEGQGNMALGDEKSGEYRPSTVGGKGQRYEGRLPAHPLKMLTTPYECRPTGILANTPRNSFSFEIGYRFLL